MVNLKAIGILSSENIQIKILYERYNFDGSLNYKNYIKTIKITENSISEINGINTRTFKLTLKIISQIFNHLLNINYF